MSYFPRSSSHLRRLGVFAVAVALVGLSVVGCVRLLEPRTDDARYYVLESTREVDALSADTTGLSVGLRKPRLASYLDAMRIVSRRGPNSVQFAEFHRWGEDLTQGISRTVALALEAQPNVRSVEVTPWRSGATFDYIIQLRVLGFEGVGPSPPGPDADDDAPVPEGESKMVTQWTIFDSEADTVLARGVTRDQREGWPVNDYEDLVSKLSTSLHVLADAIGTRLEALNRP